MKKSIAFIIGISVLVFLAVLFGGFFITGYLVFPQGEPSDKLILGYCPTMYEEALAFSEDVELVEFVSASEVLFALNREQIDFGLVGRKAKFHEISDDISEEILESGYTLVSNKKGFIDYSQLRQINIHTYLDSEIVERLVSSQNIVYYDSQQEVIDKISDGEVVLISWDDWNDEFELIVVMDGNEKAKDFRGVFLYEIQLNKRESF